MTTSDFAAYKAIIISDIDSSDPADIQFLVTSKDSWSPAVKGNMVVIGSDPADHSYFDDGALNLIKNSVAFAAADTVTGFYLALGQMWDGETATEIEALSNFGKFVVHGEIGCYNDIHIVASGPAIDGLTDDDLSNWGCSAHEVFTEFPTSGTGGWQALAIAQDVLEIGSMPFADGSQGIAHIITRGATPVGCGDGVVDEVAREECDLGALNGQPGELCDKSCHCLYGVGATPGECLPEPVGSAGPSGSGSVIPGPTNVT